MVNSEILSGLNEAISHGSTLKKAMESFYQAGYKKEDIEEAAKIIYEKQTSHQKENILETKKEPIKKRDIIKKSEEVIKQKLPKQLKQTLQIKTISKVSKYGEEKKKKLRGAKYFILITILIISLVILIGTLVGIFLLRDKFF